MAPNDVLPKAKLRVLIADDFQETRRSVRIMLSMNPNVLVVAIARDGEEAVELAREYHPDVVVLDVNMPKKTGLEAFREISHIYPETACIIITAEKETNYLGEAMTLGAQEYLLKPFTIDELNEAVDRAGVSVEKSRQKLLQAGQLMEQTEAYLKKKASEYTRSKRIDDQALAVFEQLAKNPACEIQWLRTLAILYVLRQEWHKLKTLATRLEESAANQNKILGQDQPDGGIG